MSDPIYVLLTPAEHYAEAGRLVVAAAEIDPQPCPGYEDCSRPGNAGQCGHYLDAIDQRDYLLDTARIHTQLAQVPEPVAAAGIAGRAVAADAAEPVPGQFALDASTACRRIAQALDVLPFGEYDGAHHKDWVLDQVARALTGPDYAHWIAAHPGWAHGPAEGIAP